MFSYDARNVPTICDWEGAKRLYDRAAPINAKGIARLSARTQSCFQGTDPRYLETTGNFKRKPRVNIRELKNGAIALRLHDTDVVTYHANGDVAFEPYDSVSTRRLLDRVSPVNVRHATGSVVIVGRAPERFYKWDHIDPLLFCRSADGRTLEYVSGAQATTRRRVDKEKLMELRAALKGFYQWAAAVMDLSGGSAPLSNADLRNEWGSGTVNFIDVPLPLLQRVQAGDMEQYPKLLAFCRSRVYDSHVSRSELAKLETRLCKQLRLTVTETIPIGEKPRKDLV
jgi:hypothetical protein